MTTAKDYRARYQTLIPCFLITGLLSLTLLVAGCTKEAAYKRPIKHPGKLELTYYGYMVDDPSRHRAIANGKEFFTTKETVAPSIQSMFLLEHTEVKAGETILDLGTGSGIQAVFAAEKGAKVIATDLSENAIQDARYNAEYHNVADKIEFRSGDLFGPIKANEKFDRIIFNIDYPYDENSLGLWKVHERFFREVRRYLQPGGTIYYQAGWLWNVEKVIKMIFANDMIVDRMYMAHAVSHNREPLVMVIKVDPKVAKRRHNRIQKVEARKRQQQQAGNTNEQQAPDKPEAKAQ